MFQRNHCLLLGAAVIVCALRVSATEPLLRQGDTLAIVGGTVIERMQYDGHFEAELQSRRPDWRLRVRNLGWSGDDSHGFARKMFETSSEKGLERMLGDLALAKPTVVLVAYGFAEASNGAGAMERFEPGLRHLAAELQRRDLRLILMRPFVLPGVRTDEYAARIDQAAGTVDRVAEDLQAGVVSVDVSGWSVDDWTLDALTPSGSGYRRMAAHLADALVGPADRGQSADDTAYDADLRRLVVDKNELFFHRHRPQNETYLLLFRKHEQGQNASELAEFDPLVEAADARIWDHVRVRQRSR